MTQVIDKSALIAEIERRIKTNKQKAYACLRNPDYYQGKVDALNDILSFLDTLEMKEESVSENLEEAANDYAHDLVHDDVFENFIAGAQWQKEQMMKEAVETTVSSMVHQLIVTDYIIVNAEQFGLKKGDKVKVLIIKEE